MALTPEGAADIKREILRGYDQEKMRKKVIPNISGMGEDDIVDMGNELLKTTETKGWLTIQEWIVHDANPEVVLDLKSDFDRGIVKGEMRIMQRVKAIISARDEILGKRKEKEDAEKEGEINT